MSATATSQAHIAYELINDKEPGVVVIEFLSHEVASSLHSRELGEQLQSLIGTELPQNFVIDFANVRSLGNTAFGEIVSFAREAEASECLQYTAEEKLRARRARPSLAWTSSPTLPPAGESRSIRPGKRPCKAQKTLWDLPSIG